MEADAQIQSKQRSALAEYLPGQKHSLDIRSMTTAQTTLLMAIYDLEEARTSRARPSVILQYFCNESINSSSLIGCLDAIAHKACSDEWLKLIYRSRLASSNSSADKW
jgi:phosphatidylinositol 4-kinase